MKGIAVSIWGYLVTLFLTRCKINLMICMPFRAMSFKIMSLFLCLRVQKNMAEAYEEEEEDDDDEQMLVPKVRVAEDGSLILDEERCGGLK